jgi:hypothetical protein
MLDKKDESEKRKVVETLDLTPSWVAVLSMMLAVLDNKKASAEGRKGALDTLKQMAQVADQTLNLHKKGLVVSINLLKEDLGQYGEAYYVVFHFSNGKEKRIKIEEHVWAGELLGFFEGPPDKFGQFEQDVLYRH